MYYSAKTLYLKSDLCIPRNMKLSGLVPQFLHSCICERFLYSQQNRQIDPGGIYKSLREHECRNWERGHAVSFLGIHKSDYHCSVINLSGLHNTVPDNAVRKDMMNITDTTAQFVLKGGRKEGPADQYLATPVFDLHKCLHTRGREKHPTVHNCRKFFQQVTFKAKKLDCLRRFCR